MKRTPNLRTFLARWGKDQRGNVAVLLGLSLPVITGAAAFGVETGYWYYDQHRLQQSADAAAYAAGVENRAGSTIDVMRTAATAAAASNGFVVGVDQLALSNPPTSGPNQNNRAVEVILTRTSPRFFSNLITTAPVILRGRAVSTSVTDANACVLSLDKAAHRAVYFSGSSTINLVGCNVMSNSIANDSVYSQGATTVNLPCLMAAGGADINAGVHMSACAAPMTQLPPVADPFKDLPAPAVSGNCQNDNGATLQPGRYCGGLDLKNAKTLKPGVYIIDGGTLKTNGSAVVTGAGVTFYLANNADLSFNGNASLSLSAPTSGTYSGVLFFGARTNSAASAVTLNGTAGSAMTGAIYFPSQPVSYIGDMAGANGCTQIVAKTVSWSGNATFKADCSAYGMGPLPVGGMVRLSE